MRADADFFCLPVEQLYFDKLTVSVDSDLSFSLTIFNFVSCFPLRIVLWRVHGHFLFVDHLHKVFSVCMPPRAW